MAEMLDDYDAPADDDADTATLSLSTFDGDTGQLPMPARRVFVRLLLGPSIDAQRQTLLWPALVEHEAVLRSRLHELFLELIVDLDQGVAFTRQVSDTEASFPILLRRKTLTFSESLLALFLRQRLTQADMTGERAAVDKADMISHLALFQKATITDIVGFTKQADNAIEKMKANGLLHAIRGSADRFTVSATLRLLFGPEQVQSMTATYAAMREGGAPARLAPDAPSDSSGS
jgi:hypothetical protein